MKGSTEYCNKYCILIKGTVRMSSGKAHAAALPVAECSRRRRPSLALAAVVPPRPAVLDAFRCTAFGRVHPPGR